MVTHKDGAERYHHTKENQEGSTSKQAYSKTNMYKNTNLIFEGLKFCNLHILLPGNINNTNKYYDRIKNLWQLISLYGKTTIPK